MHGTKNEKEVMRWSWVGFLPETQEKEEMGQFWKTDVETVKICTMILIKNKEREKMLKRNELRDSPKQPSETA